MTRLRPIAVLRMLALALLTTASFIAAAQEYPSKSISMVVPYPPGSGSDVAARVISNRLSELVHQQILIDNRPGASTNIGTEYVAKAAPDGYTLLFQAPNLATNQWLFANPRWTSGDFAAVILIGRYSNVLAAGPSAPTHDFRELLALTKKTPKAYTYGSPGVGSVSNLATELLKQRTGLSIEHVSYRGPSQMAVDLAGGHIPYAVSNLNNVLNIMRDSKSPVKPLLVLASKRDPAAPDVPCLGDLGISNLEGSGWYGIVAPGKTPKAVVQRLNVEIGKVLETPDVRARLKEMFLDIAGGSPEVFARFLDSETQKWGETVRQAGMKAE